MIIRILVVFIVFLIIHCYSYADGAITKVIIASGPTSGLYYQTSAYLCEIIKREDKIPCEVLVTKGSQENLSLINSNKVTFALIQDNYSESLQPKQVIKTLYNEYLMLLSKKDYSSVSIYNFAGSSYYADPNSGVYKVIQDLVNTFQLKLNLKTEVSKLSYQEELDKLCNNEINFKVLIVGQPSSVFQELKFLCNIQIYNFSNQELALLKDSNKSYKDALISHKLYNTKEDIHTVSLGVILVSNKTNSKEYNKHILEILEKSKEMLKENNKHFNY